MHSDFSLKTVAISLTLTIFLVPNKKNEFGPFSYKFVVPIRVGLKSHFVFFSSDAPSVCPNVSFLISCVITFLLNTYVDMHVVYTFFLEQHHSSSTPCRSRIIQITVELQSSIDFIELNHVLSQLSPTILN